MARDSYGIVQWYIDHLNKGFDLEDDKFSGDTREKVKEESSERFFNKVMREAVNRSTGKKSNLMESLKTNPNFRRVSLSQIRDDNRLISKSEEYFNNKLTSKIDKSRLIKGKKEEFKLNVPQYDEVTELDESISNSITALEGIKSDFKSAATLEERQEAVGRLQKEYTNTYK